MASTIQPGPLDLAPADLGQPRRRMPVGPVGALLVVLSMVALGSSQHGTSPLPAPAPAGDPAFPGGLTVIEKSAPRGQADAGPSGHNSLALLTPEARKAWQEALAAAFAPAPAPPQPTADMTPAAGPSQSTMAAADAPSARLIPLPVPRPPEFQARPPAEPVRTAVRRSQRRQAVAAAPSPMEDTRSFFDKLFGIDETPKPALAYAALETAPMDKAFRNRLVGPTVPPVSASPGGGTAIYDITARAVIMPNGERLEAHSGLGDSMDNPNHVHRRMRGSTPPGTYDLTERESLFHGVRAIRLNPVGGSAAIHGRDGILAHTYMLGPSGASNGCVSFKDYDKFLQAYLRGEVQRLVVVASR